MVPRAALRGIDFTALPLGTLLSAEVWGRLSPDGLRARMLVIILLMSMPFAAFSLWSAELTRASQLQNAEAQLQSFARAIAIGQLETRDDPGTFETRVEGYDLPEVVEVALVDAEGRLLGLHPQGSGAIGATYPLARGGRPLPGEVRVLALGDRLVAVTNAGTEAGGPLILVSAATDEYVAGKGLFWLEFGPAALLMAIMAAALWIGASRLLFAPLDQLLLTIEAFGRGDLQARAPAVGARELNRLANVFNQMAESLNKRQTALEASNAELENFAYVASHDLKAPLRAIDNLATWIGEDLPNTVQGEVHEHLDLMRARVGRMQSLLDDLLQFSRAGRKNGDLGQIQVDRLVRDQFELIGAPEGFVLEARRLPELRTYGTPLGTVFRNLLSNAIKHHDRDTGRIMVSAAERGGIIEFSVEDDGPGIADEYQERVFGLFQTLRPRDQVEGSGMGLALVKKLVEARGGRVRLASSPPARGATFTFTWPIDEGGA